MACKKIYISPSNQSGNMYVVENVSEKMVMEEIATYLKEILESVYNCENVMMAPSDMSIKDRAIDAKDKEAEIYVALHSNAGGGNKAFGAIAFYHPKYNESRELAHNIVSELNKISPYPSNRKDPVKDGMAVFNGRGYLEIRLPGENGIIPALAEIDFHDNPLTARYILENKKKIASTLARTLDMTFKLKEEKRFIMSFRWENKGEKM